jgi:hypothetical protein
VLLEDIEIDRNLHAGPLSDLTDEELAALLYAARNAVAKGKTHDARSSNRRSKLCSSLGIS